MSLSHSLKLYFSFTQLADESFDTVLDKGALDALMEPEVGTKLGNQYLSEVLVNFFCLRNYIIIG